MADSNKNSIPVVQAAFDQIHAQPLYRTYTVAEVKKIVYPLTNAIEAYEKDQTSSVAALEAEWSAIQAEEDALHRRRRETAKKLDAARLEARPTMPTPEQVEGIRRGLQDIRNGVESPSHHGHSTGGGVYVHARGWLHVNHGSPYALADSSMLWHFSIAEVEAFIQIIQAEGFRVTHHWISDGVSIEVQENKNV